MAFLERNLVICNKLCSACSVSSLVNVCADESVLNEKGRVDPAKLQPITFDPMNNDYLVLGEKVGNAFGDGLKLR